MHNPLEFLFTMDVHLVSSIDSDEFTHLTRALSRSTLIGLDAEWKPIRSQQSTFPTVTLLQLACQLGDDPAEWDESLVFLLDLASIPLSSIWELLKDVFVSPDILKLGFKFKQDLIFLSSTFGAEGCDPAFDKVSYSLEKKNGQSNFHRNIVLRFCLTMVNRWSPIWTSRTYTSFCNINKERRYQRIQRVCQLYVKKCWVFLFPRYVFLTPKFSFIFKCYGLIIFVKLRNLLVLYFCNFGMCCHLSMQDNSIFS